MSWHFSSSSLSVCIKFDLESMTKFELKASQLDFFLFYPKITVQLVIKFQGSHKLHENIYRN